ncbi:MAG: hypothetical protein HYY41_06675, partial [Chloroflexi bacterium]|nr:hypothetical protein [Chloroflexota bacterium]
DHLRDITREDTESLLKSTPTLKVAKYLEAVNALWPRVDNPKLPWYDKKVRYALNMAIDRQTISKDFYGGDAEIVAYPAVPDAAYKNVGIYIPLGEMSPTARQLYEYNPEKAKQLLAEAGYPKGFKIEVITVAKTVDEISILKDYLAKIGVDVQIALKEQSVFTSVTRSRGQSEAVYGSVSSAVPYGWQAFRPTDPTNLGAIDDPVVNKAIADFAGYFSIDDKKAFGEIMAGVFPYILEQAWIVQFPAPYRYTLWHPWVKNYHGEWLVGTGILWNFVNWTWIDQGLKKSLGF